MKIIFILALLVFVGAEMDKNSNDDKNDANSAFNFNIFGEDGIEFGKTGSGSSSVQMKAMMEKWTNICIDVKLPKELYDSFNKCVKEEFKKSSILDNMLEGKFPGKKDFATTFESLEMCKLKSGGINDLDKDYTMENIMKILMYDKWTGKKEDIEELKEKLTTCFDEAEGNGFMKVISHHKCLTDYYLTKCREVDEEPGLLLRLGVKILTLHEDSKCASVKLPEKDKQIREECMNEAKEVFLNSSDSSDEDPVMKNMKNLPEQLVKPIKLVIRFLKDYILKGMLECYGDRTGIYNKVTKLMNMTVLAEQVREYEGWEGIEQVRDAVYEAMLECGQEYEMEAENKSDDEKLKDLEEDNDNFDACFTPKFATICGYNNDLSATFDPFMDPEFLGKLVERFKEVGGKEAEAVLSFLKAALQKFKST